MMWNAGFEALFPGQSNLFSIAQLSVDAVGLVVTLPPSSIGGFDYNYGSDPDLTGQTITIVEDYRGRVQGGGVSVHLTDANGKHLDWGFDQTGSSGTATLILDAGGGKQGADRFNMDPGFDLKTVKQITGDFYGAEGTVRSLTVGSTKIIPEPSSIALLGVGVAGLLGYAWRRSKQAAA
jgi:hypothetical protein